MTTCYEEDGLSDQQRLDDMLGIVRCARCGQRLEGEIECPFCSMFPDKPIKQQMPKWVFVTACFLTSPLSLYFVLTSKRLNTFEKAATISGCLMWLGIYRLF